MTTSRPHGPGHGHGHGRNRSRNRNRSWSMALAVATVGVAAGLLPSVAPARPAAPSAAATPHGEPGPNELKLAWLDRQGQLQVVTLDANGQVRRPRGAGIVAAANDRDHAENSETADAPPRASSARTSAPQVPPSATQVAASAPQVPPSAPQVPLGSLWKLIAYARLTDNASHEAPYTCRGRDPEEVYCCDAGQRIDRATAIWRSCGLYFDPRRIGFDQLPLGDTLAALPNELRSLQQADALRSTTRVDLAAWLSWLNDWSPAARQHASDDLLAYWLQGPGQPVLSSIGSRLRVKTFTVEREDPGAAGLRWSGASGWTDDGTPIWMAARGTSAQVVPAWAARVLSFLDSRGDQGVAAATRAAPSAAATAATAQTTSTAPTAPADTIGAGGPCIDVEFFSRYPIRRLTPQPASAGPLPARAYRVEFDNGQQLAIESRRDLSVSFDKTATLAETTDSQGRSANVGALPGRLRLNGRFTLDDYVARVIEREGSGQPRAAARALAVAARTYVLAHGESRNGCLSIADSSATQRVAPRPPGAAARAAASFTTGLVLNGAVGQYRTRDSADGVMSWQASVQAADAGAGFDSILRDAYPRASLASMGSDGASSCEPLVSANGWLQTQRARWHPQLLGQAGYRQPGSVQVCRLQAGRPYAVRDSQRVYVSGATSLEERLTLTHEYLHLAFSGHPRGNDETFVEQRARALLGIE